MFYYSFDEKSCKPFDLTRSTESEPYFPDYGVSDIADDYAEPEFDPTGEKEVRCKLSKNERQYATPSLKLSDEEIGRLLENAAVFFSKVGALHPEFLERGFHDGIRDIAEYGERHTFAKEEFHPANYLVGYELGVYLAVIHGDARPAPNTRPSRTRMLQEFAKKGE